MTVAALIVTLLRHGEVEGYAHAFIGERDPPLSAAGWSQMRAAIDAAGVPPLTAIACSPRGRCRAFAERLAGEQRLELDVLPALAEMRFGEWEGLTNADVEARDPERLAAFRADPSRAGPQGGEPYLDFARRVRDGFAAWTSGRRGHALVVTHAGVIRALLADCLGLAPTRLARIALAPAATCRLSLAEGEPPCLLALNFAALPCAV
jgi:broad specificity phosphatase PhoE